MFSLYLLQANNATDQANTEANKRDKDESEEKRISANLGREVTNPTDCSSNKGINVSNDSSDSSSSLGKHSFR